MHYDPQATNMMDLSPEPERSRDGNIALFLALYLLVLAFFILLVSISTIETDRTKAVLHSVTNTFSPLIPPSETLTTLSSDAGDIIAAQQFQEEITKIFATTISVAKTEVMEHGATMRITLPVERLFFPDETRFRDASLSMLDRVVTSLSGRPDGLRYDVEFVIGTRYASGSALPVAQSLEMRRAGAFARELAARGAPPDSVNLGLRPTAPDRVEIWFFVRDRERSRLRFSEATPLGPSGGADSPNPGANLTTPVP